MQWLSLALALLQVYAWFLSKAQLDAGARAAVADALRVQADELQRATKARDETRERNAAVPATDSLPDDSFRRD